DDGHIVLTLKTAWADGTRQLVFEPLELLEKLAALIPRPRINLVLYHGVLAPHSGWRARVVAYGAPPAEAPVVASAAPEANDESTTAPVPFISWSRAPLPGRKFTRHAGCPRCTWGPARRGGVLRMDVPSTRPLAEELLHFLQRPMAHHQLRG